MWQVELTENVRKWLKKLPQDHKHDVLALIKVLSKLGNTLEMPLSNPLGFGLYELRNMQYGYRIYYCFNVERVILLVKAGNKTSQQKDIAKAYTLIKKLRGPL